MEILCQSLCIVCRRHQALTVRNGNAQTHLLSQRRRTDTTARLRHFSSSRKRRRKVPRELSLTKRDRIRLHQERPEEALTGILVSRSEAAEVLESRLTEARKFVYNFWSEGDGPRPARQGPTMDGRWWFWNICLALTPATMIGLYCEFFVEDEMHEFFEKMDLEQQKRIMGEDYVMEQEAIERTPIITEQGFGQKTKEAVRELVSLSSASEPNPTDEEPPSPEQTNSTTDEESAKEQNDEVSVISNGRPPVDDRELLLTLRHRIDALENELEKQQRRQDQRRSYQMERMQQSGIRNRVEDRMVQDWEAQRQQRVSPPEDAASMSTNGDKTLSEKMREAAWVGLRQNISDKKEAMERYGIDVMDRAWGFWEEANDEQGDPAAEEEGSPGTNDSSVEQSSQHAKTSPMHDEVVKKVQETAEVVGEVADTVASSVSSDPHATSQAASRAAEAAQLAAESAQLAAESISSQSCVEQSWWRRLFRRKQSHTEADTEKNEPEPSHEG